MPPTNLPSQVGIFGVVWGSEPPNEIFENFVLRFFPTNDFPQNLHIDGDSHALSTQKIWGNSDETFLRNWGLKFLGRRPLLEFDHLGGQTPDLTRERYSPRRPEKNGF